MAGEDVEMNHKIRAALNEIGFIQRYEALAQKFSAERTPQEECLAFIDGEEVMQMIADRGYSPRFDAGEKFYKIEEEKVGAFSFGFHIILRYGRAELVWVVREGGELLLGSPWGSYSRRLISPDYRIKAPVFGSYEDLEEILKTAFEMYEDFKKSLLKA